ncbi:MULTISPECIES: hypothetical protein [Natrialbaceae]|nr:hypothetical protein [Natronococcus sp. CG52]
MVGKLIALFTLLLLVLFLAGAPAVAEFTTTQLCGPLESLEC